MGFFADYEDEKKKRKIDGSKTSTAKSFFQDELPDKVGDVAETLTEGLLSTGQRIGTTAAQGVASIATPLAMGIHAATGDKEGLKKDEEDYKKFMQETTDAKAIDGGGLSYISADTLKGESTPLEFGAEFAKAGADTATIIQPELRATSLPKAIAIEGGVNAATGGLADAADQYAKTGEINGEQVMQSAVQNGLLAAGLRGVVNRTATGNQVKAKAEMQDGTQAAKQATDETGTPVTQSQVINAAEPAVTREPVIPEADMDAFAQRPVGQSATDFLKEKNQSMAAEVTPGKDLEIEMDMGKPIGEGETSNAITGIVAKPMKVNDMGRYEKVSALDEAPLPQTKALAPEVQQLVDTRVARNDATGKTGQAKFLDRYTKGFINRSTEEAGAFGGDIASSMVKGNKVKTDIGNNLRPLMQDIDKGVKKVAGKTEVGQEQFMGKVDAALQDRPNSRAQFDSDEQYEIYQKIEKVYDFVKNERVARDLPVREDYSPTQMIRAGGEDPSYLASALTNKITTADSRFSKARTGDGAEQAVFNTRDLFNYVNSQSTEFAYKEAADMFKEGIKNVPPEIASSKSFQNGIKNLSAAYEKAVNPSATTKGDKAIKFFQSTVYKNILWNNPKNTAFSAAQTLIARGDVTSEAKAIAKALDKDTLAQINDQKWFGDATVSADMQSDTRMTQLAQGASKYDMNRKGEEYAVKKPFALGFSQGISETAAYKAAIKEGKSKADAVKVAMDDPAAKEYALRSGNILVNDTAFGANSMARPEFLRDASAMKRAFTMFMRFPLGMTELVQKSLRPAEARAVNVLMKGDPRATPVPEMRQKYQKTLVALNDIEKAAKDGKLGDIKLEAVQDSIKLTKENIKTVDETIKSLSSIRGKNRAAALAKMWAATAAIQFAWTGLTDPENASPIDAVAAADPTIASKVNPMNPYSVERSGLTSPLIPANRYGINWNGAANLVPGAGIANRGVKLATGKSAVDWLRGKE